jgi:3-dehydroquinate dehydratase II
MILLVNGPNLNLLGEREPEIYGYETLADVERMVREACAAYGVEVKAFQSNWEGALLDFLQEHRGVAQGVILNPGALTHTSRALPDCLRALPCPTVEVHVSNVHAREAWRHESFVAPAAQGQIVGLGVSGYYFAALHLCSQIAARAEAEAGGEEQASAAEGGDEAAGASGHGAEPSVGAEHTRWSWPGGSGELVPAAPGEEIPVDREKRGEYEPL